MSIFQLKKWEELSSASVFLYFLLLIALFGCYCTLFPKRLSDSSASVWFVVLLLVKTFFCCESLLMHSTNL